ncbi:hypothetical protein ACRE_061040 [Hapsidospora chrysogenum ATCC 11550]|uniref:Thioesterase domain-containing protein n=1 Tax=Hapsidospora chrysogenum (strain ATCC 11550 / CBS 779.69 / DSM 880 / IAM 14645 / JCM 23072 / IMI 49137) TaxID=857340 RepID=A0A086T1A9_HAPC1|nr:hypothetical protein ACRE_061040 [Hapsidospora chrysogenum ATCC 11550]
MDGTGQLPGGVGRYGHVNNVVYNRFAESSRVNWFRNFAKAADEEHRQQWIDLMTPRSIGLILKSIKTDYKLPIVYPDTVTVAHKLLAPPTRESTNVDMEVVIFSHDNQRPAARCFEDVVIYDYRVGRKANLESFMVEELQAVYELQEATKQKSIQEVLELQKTLD